MSAGKVKITTKTVDELRKAVAFLTERNERGPFVPWETTKGFVIATPDTIPERNRLFSELRKAGFSVVALIDDDSNANLARIRAALAKGAKPVLGFGDFGIPAEGK